MKTNNKVLAIAIFFGTLSSADVQAISTKFVARAFQSCTKNCASDTIKCLNNKADVTGSYAWCKACDYEGKTNRQVIQAALKKCDEERERAAQEQAEALSRIYQNEHSEQVNTSKETGQKDLRYAR